MNVDPDGNLFFSAIIVGAVIGFLSVYVPDVVENVKDGFQFSDLLTINKDNWVEYAANTFGGALTGLIGASGMSLLLSAPLTGGINTGVAYLSGDIKTWTEAKQCFAISTFLSGLTLGSQKYAKFHTSKVPNISKGLNTPFNRAIEKTIYTIEKGLYAYGQNVDNAVALTMLAMNIRKAF
jgi:hypothetical protein